MHAQDFNWDLGPALAGFLAESAGCLSETEHRTLESLIVSTANASSTNAQKQNALNTLSICLLRPCLTMSMVAWFRPLILDLVGRWKSLIVISTCPHHREDPSDEDNHSNLEQSAAEQMAFAFGRMLPIAPQIEPYVLFVSMIGIESHLTFIRHTLSILSRSPHLFEIALSTTSSEVRLTPIEINEDD
jgi:hypothetical protein